MLFTLTKLDSSGTSKFNLLKSVSIQCYPCGLIFAVYRIIFLLLYTTTTVNIEHGTLHQDRGGRGTAVQEGIEAIGGKVGKGRLDR